MQRAGLEAILGLQVKGAFLHLSPSIPREWPGYEITFLYRSSTYRITVENTPGGLGGSFELAMDGEPYSTKPPRLPLLDDGRAHHVTLRIGGGLS